MAPPRRERPPEPDAITRAGRLIGLGGIVASALFWAATARISAELLGIFGSLWGFTEAGAAIKELRRR